MRISRICFRRGRAGRPVPASVMASVMVLQVLHDYSDVEAAEAARCDLRWKAACGFPLDLRGLIPRRWVYWRRADRQVSAPGNRIDDAVGRSWWRPVC